MDIEERKLKYRQKHPNCEWCYWFKYNSPLEHGIDCPDYFTCDLKDQFIHFPKIKAKLCKQYYVRGDNK